MKLFYSLTGILFISLLAIFLIVPLFLPDHKEVKVSSSINGPKNIVFSHFNNLKKQVSHNSFLEQDSALGKFFYNPYEGQTANFRWKSFNPEIGSGDILITQSNKDTIRTLVTFEETKNSYSEEFVFDSISPNETQITWYRKGSPVSYLKRYLLLFEDNSEKEILLSLNNAKEDIESVNYANTTTTVGEIKKEYFDGMKLLVYPEETDLNNSKIASASKFGISKVQRFLNKNKSFDSVYISLPMVYIQEWDTMDSKVKLDCGFSVNTDIGNKPKDFKIMALPAGEVYTYAINGNYKNIDSLYNYLHAYVKKLKVIPSRHFWVEDVSKDSISRIKGYLEINPDR